MALRHAYRRGDVVWVEFPFGDQVGNKERPALVLSTDAYHDEWNEVLAAALTSQRPKNPRPTDSELQDWALAGLSRPSWSRSRLHTIHHYRIQRRAGSLSARDLAAIEACLRSALGL